MPTTAATLLIGLVTTVVVGLVDDQGWPSYVIGAVLALALWVMLFFGSFGAEPRYHVPWLAYAALSAVAVVLGYAVVAMTGQSAFWGVGFIMAGALWPAAGAARRDRAGR